MTVKKLYIKNYRCFGSNPTVIEFSESRLNALIGPNNVGKSSVLKALEILLGDKWPFGRFTEEDFHNYNLQNEIILACQFFDEISVQLSGNNSIRAKGVAVGAKYLSTGYGDTSISVKYKLLQDDKDFNELNFDTLDSFKSISAEIRNQLPIVITVPLAKLTTEQPTNRWSVLGRLLQRVDDEFRSDESRKRNFEEKMKEAVEILRTEEFEKIEDSIREFWKEMEPKNLTGIELKFLDYDPWRLYRQFRLSVKQNDKYVPIETLSEGVQRLAVIAIYRTYLAKHQRAQNAILLIEEPESRLLPQARKTLFKNAILLIEEPESYLHPQARKTLFKALKNAVSSKEKKGQIIFSTHSEDFVECENFDNILIFICNEENGSIEVRHINEEKLKNHCIALGYSTQDIRNLRISYRLKELDTQGLKEALFSNKAIIVEGPSEVELFRFFSDAEKEQIAIVSARGKGNIPSIYSFLTAFGIPCFVVIDRDSNPKENARIVKILTQENAQNPDENKMDISVDDIMSVKDGEIYYKDRLLVFGKDLETVLENNIKNFEELIALLIKEFNLPSRDNKKLRPHHIHALGLVFIENINNISNELKREIENARESLIQLRETLNTFLSQQVKPPKLLNPKNV